MRRQGLAALCLAALSVSAAPETRRLASAPGRHARALGLPAAPGSPHRHVRARASNDGVNWSPWLEAVTDPDSGTLLWFDSPFTLFELQNAGDAPALLIDPGVTPRQTLAEGEIQGRDAWCPAPFVCPKSSSPSSTTPTHLIVHHTASANTASDWAAVMRSFWELHVRGNGWADIGYNFLIDPTGTVWEGRGDGVLGAHFSAVNTGTAGVALIGTFTGRAPAPAALDKLASLLAWQARKYNLDPAGQSLHAASGLELDVISGHRDAGLSPRASGRTECPGVALYPLLPALREQVCAALPGCLPARQRPNSCLEAGAARCLSRYGIVNSANFDPRPVARGSIASAFGANLEGLAARVNGRAAAITGATANQVNFLVPAATEPGIARLQLLDGATVRTERLFAVTETAPAVYAAVGHEGPIAPGRPLSVFLAGAQSGLEWSAAVAGLPADKLYLGPAPGFPGLWQSNLVVPPALPAGTHDLTLTISGVPSAPFPIQVN